MGKILNNGGRLGKTVDYNTSTAYTTGSSNKKNSGVWNLDSAVKVIPADYSAFNGSASVSETGFDYSFTYPVTGVVDGTTVDITASGTNITTSDFGGTGGWAGSLTQTATITGGNISFSFSPSLDAFTEGTETVNFTLAATDSAGNATGSPTLSVTITDDSKTIYYGASTATGYTNPASQNEGASATYYFYTANRTDGFPVDMYWSINASTADFEFISGTCNYVTQVNNYPNSGDFAYIYSVNLGAHPDATTEGTENFTLSFREGSTSGTVRATTTVTINDTSTSPVSYGVRQYSDATPNEGTAMWVDFYVANATPTMYWTIDSGTSDFATGSGTVNWSGTTVANYPTVGSTGYLYRVNLSVTADNTTEGNEYHYIRFRSGSTSGTIQATGLVHVQDTSTTPSSGGGSTLWPLPLSVFGQHSTTAWSTHTIDLSSYVGQTGRLVVWYETGTNYTGDLQIDQVVLNGTTYSFETDGEGWQTTNGDQNTTSATTSHYEGLVFTDVVTGTSGMQWLRDTGGTGSSGTGLATAYNGSYYLYAETSGSGWPWSMWLRSPEVTLTNGNCSFALGRYGATIGTANFYWYDSGSATNTMDYSSSFVQIAARQIYSDIDMGSSVDYNGPYDLHVTEPVSESPAGQTARVYLGVKVTSATTFYSDLPIACVQHFSSTGTLKNSWNFSSSTGGTGSGWTTTTAGVLQPSPGMNTTPLNASGLGYVSISSGATANRFNWATSTGSSWTGAAGGISTIYDTNAITTSQTTNDALPQFDANYFMYMEASGSTLNQAHFARSPAVNIVAGDYFKIAYVVTGYSANPQNSNDCLWFGIY